MSNNKAKWKEHLKALASQMFLLRRKGQKYLNDVSNCAHKYLNIILNIFQTIYLRFYPYPFYITLINVQFYPFWFSKTILGETSETKAMLKHKREIHEVYCNIMKEQYSPALFAVKTFTSAFRHTSGEILLLSDEMSSKRSCHLSYKDRVTSTTQPTI